MFSYGKISIRKQFFTGFDIKKSLAFGSTFFMSHPAKNCFPISTFPCLNTIWRTNSYCLTSGLDKNQMILPIHSLHSLVTSNFHSNGKVVLIYQRKVYVDHKTIYFSTMVFPYSHFTTRVYLSYDFFVRSGG